MGLFGHMRIHDSGIHRNADNTDTPYRPSTYAIHTATATPTTTNDIPPALPNFSCPHCARKLTSRTSLVSHLRIHRTDASEPWPGGPIYSRRARLHCPHCSRTFAHHTCDSTTPGCKPLEAKRHQRTLFSPIHRQHHHHHPVPDKITVS
ncbi:unnamed protein product [Schistocephalus solidus]|uniref:C2H2-type domain-containing protein n=1 Tax=Schistocephalus solidus TaxID=70667 RepID=A0A183SXP4_SCHSO|nr:unnamed protein product [Schistocephalus solidus]